MLTSVMVFPKLLRLARRSPFPPRIDLGQNPSHCRTVAIAALLIVISDPLAAWADGTVNFNNNVSFSTPADRLVYIFPGEPLVGTNWAAQLYYGPDPMNLVSVNETPARFRIPTTTLPGTWVGGTRILPGFNPGETVWLQVRVWDINRFPSYEAAVAGGGPYSLSSPFTYAIPAAPSPPQAYFMENFRAFGPLSDPRPIMTASQIGGQQLVLYWSHGRLQHATTLSPPDWQNVVVTNNQRQILIPATQPMQLFRIVDP